MFCTLSTDRFQSDQETNNEVSWWYAAYRVEISCTPPEKEALPWRYPVTHKLRTVWCCGQKRGLKKYQSRERSLAPNQAHPNIDQIHAFLMAGVDSLCRFVLWGITIFKSPIVFKIWSWVLAPNLVTYVVWTLKKLHLLSDFIFFLII